MADTHAQIIQRSGKDHEIAEAVGAKSHQVRDWRLRDSIPSAYWKAFVEHGFANWVELGDAAARSSLGESRPAGEQDAAA